jgi:hypothetical protein
LLAFWIRHCCGQLEIKVAKVNRLVGRLSDLDFVDEILMLCEVLYLGTSATGTAFGAQRRILQAAVRVPGGVGVVWWEAGECN